uniref:Uncharacterized protein n=1 Tax=Macaca fascicularis TaxID=9541 RepID=A0A7N9CV08_MACFA
MCWKLSLGKISPTGYLNCMPLCLIQKNRCRVHVHNVQVCYICILVPCWCAAPINSSFTINTSFTSV